MMDIQSYTKGWNDAIDNAISIVKTNVPGIYPRLAEAIEKNLKRELREA